MEKEKNYRPNVAAVILSPSYPLECRIFIAQRYDIHGAWQFPQGGIDKGEVPKQALLRELEEEIGTNSVEILCEHPEWLSYDFPENIAKKMSPYDGQIQKYFLVRLKPKAKINLNTKHPEFNDYRFIKQEEVLASVNHFKKAVYNKVLKYFKEEGFI
ncbi:RNA pyrophosphohydrolase [Campylobacter iguaniorum]|uniref:RNA pyrophosphohydrolase n=1 Tax=Campylobacter iguaniorum TaxID=1244531 RepID=A0A076FAK4_9BACT|nr:RNA pyrophosphohydrolase [Campylobacter iguaniorum]AII14996.1 RNA pyrophosphohydrolase [Campylobacter iguaniorum]ALV24824.1 RNA pyrophosphohydrolase [Campylobacter iguaniorum]